MNATNRILNRALLFFVGLISIATGAAILLWVIRPAWATSLIDAVPARAEALAADVRSATVAVPGVGELPIAAIVAFVVALILAVALLAFIFSRGGGTSREVHAETGQRGSTSVDRNVVDAVLTEPLERRADVLSARTSVFTVKGERSVRLAVTVRQGAQLADVLLAAQSALVDWDALLGRETPVLIHLTDRSWADRLRSTARVR